MANNKPINYQSLSAELDSILDQLQGDQPNVDKALKDYERGMEIVKQLQAYLKDSQNKVTKIKKKFTD